MIIPREPCATRRPFKVCFRVRTPASTGNILIKGSFMFFFFFGNNWALSSGSAWRSNIRKERETIRSVGTIRNEIVSSP